MNPEQTRPEWVMAGVQTPTGVRLLASKDLTQAEEAEEAFYGWGSPVLTRPTSYRYILTAEMRKFVVIEAPDYPSAFERLFKQWSPEPESRPALATAVPQIELTRPKVIEEEA